MKTYLGVEDLEVYRKLCRLHIEVCNMTKNWPSEEKYELASQVRRSSNSAPAQLAEKNDDRHIRNKIEGVNRSRVRQRKQSTTYSWPILKATLPKMCIKNIGEDTSSVSEC